ncbi:hypothetical protein Lser_V15G39438 [Lactuca serriola]
MFVQKLLNLMKWFLYKDNRIYIKDPHKAQSTVQGQLFSPK